jgi:hypothetical protein
LIDEHVRDATDLEQPKKEEREARSPRGRWLSVLSR